MDNNKSLLPTPPDGEEKKNKKPRKKKGLSKNAVSAIYMGVALCMVVMLTFSIVGTNDQVKKSAEELKLSDISFPDISLALPQPDISVGDNTVNGDNAEKPVGNDVSGVTDEVIKPDEESTESKPPEETPTVLYYRPVSGEVIKGHSVDALVFSETMQDFRIHGGVDLAAEPGTPVLAYTDGTVLKTVNDPFMGMTVEISHEKGVSSVYKNLCPELADGITEGAEVKAGQVIGTVGETALLEIADPPHLHFELWMDGHYVDAEQEMKILE